MATNVIGKKIVDDAGLINWAQQITEREKIRVRDIWAQWLQILAAFHGRPDLVTTYDLRVAKRLSRKGQKEMDDLVVNFVAPHVRTIASKAMKGRPMLEAIPSTTDEDDILAAKVGDQFLKAEWSQQRMDLSRLEAYMWAGSIGNAFMHEFYNPKLGPINMGVHIGQIQTKVVNPFKITVEPYRNRIEDCRWSKTTELLPIDQVLEDFGELYQQRTGQKLEISRESLSSKGLGDSLVDSYLSALNITEQNSQQESEFCEVTYIYHLPCAWYPQGMYAILADKKVLYLGPYPYPFLNCLPFLHFREILTPWKFYGDSSAIEVVKNQELYTRLRRIERDYHLDNLSAKWMKPRGCRVKNSSLTSRDAVIIEYNSAGGAPPPKREPGLNVPGSIFASINLAREEIDRSSGLGDASKGIASGGITSGRALLALQEQDDTRLGLTMQLMEEEWTRWGKFTLLMAKNFYDEPRKYSMAGKAKAGGIMFFETAKLGNTEDVRCVAGSAMPQNKMAKQESVLALYNAGVLGDTNDPETKAFARRALEFGQYEELNDRVSVHMSVAEKENVAMVNTGQVMPVERYDDDAIHLRCHELRANEAGVRDNPQVYMVVAAHMDMHRQSIMMKQMGAVPGSTVGNMIPTQPQANQTPQEKKDATGSPQSREDSAINSNDLREGAR